MAQGQFKKAPIAVLVVILAGGFGLRYAYNNGLLGPSSSGPAKVPEVAAMPEDTTPQMVMPQMAVPTVPLPSTSPASVSGPEIRLLGMAWNAQINIAFANGGPQTTAGSLMAKHRVNLSFIREDDVGKMQTQQIAFARALKKGDPQPKDGAHFMAIMGDGSAATIAGMWDELKKLGPEYIPEVIGSSGYSRGEDKLMGPAAWKANPKLLRGSLISGYLRDGDWNIALKFAADNNIKNNPDEKTWDPEAMNWYAANDFIEAGNKYIEGVCEDRPVVHDGKRSGQTQHVCINGVVTWTPGDVNVATKKGGLVSIVSTKQYRSQMPCTIIGIKKWDNDNRKLVLSFLGAMYEAGDQVKSNPAALTRGAEAEAVIYHEQTAAYWEKYFKGTVEQDKTGVMVELGGSSVNNLQDAIHLYGLEQGGANHFAATYTSFGNLVRQQYPKLVPSFPPVEQILNTTYTQDLASIAKTSGAPAGVADVPTFVATTEVKQVVSKRTWNINFDTGKATFSPASLPQREELKNGLLIADELAIELHGYTDDTGDPTKNKALSQSRADAVKTWLMQQGASSFPTDRFAKVEGHGSDSPVATNATEDGKAKNRRVVVILGN